MLIEGPALGRKEKERKEQPSPNPSTYLHKVCSQPWLLLMLLLLPDRRKSLFKETLMYLDDNFGREV